MQNDPLLQHTLGILPGSLALRTSLRGADQFVDLLAGACHISCHVSGPAGRMLSRRLQTYLASSSLEAALPCQPHKVRGPMAQRTLMLSLINVVLDHRSPFLCIQAGPKLVPWLNAAPRPGRRVPVGKARHCYLRTARTEAGRSHRSLVKSVTWVDAIFELLLAGSGITWRQHVNLPSRRFLQ